MREVRTQSSAKKSSFNSKLHQYQVFANPRFSRASVLVLCSNTQSKLRALDKLRIVPKCSEQRHRWLRALAKISAAHIGIMRKQDDEPASNRSFPSVPRPDEVSIVFRTIR